MSDSVAMTYQGALDKIAAVEAERDRFKALYEDYSAEVEELQKERDSLREENATFHRDGLMVYGRKIDLLRERVRTLTEALEKIRKWTRGMTTREPIWKTADEALKGARESTPPASGPKGESNGET